jgi:hypothetical protein
LLVYAKGINKIQPFASRGEELTQKRHSGSRRAGVPLFADIPVSLFCKNLKNNGFDIYRGTILTSSGITSLDNYQESCIVCNTQGNNTALNR